MVKVDGIENLMTSLINHKIKVLNFNFKNEVIVRKQSREPELLRKMEVEGKWTWIEMEIYVLYKKLNDQSPKIIQQTQEIRCKYKKV